MAEELGAQPEEFLARLVTEKLREAKFRHIEFRTRGKRRDAYLQGHRLAVWEVARIARELNGGAAECATYLQWPEHLIADALAYAAAFPDEVEARIEEAEAVTVEDLKKIVPNLIVYER
jgi:hypothetical protein